MSWDSYVSSFLMVPSSPDGPTLECAAICGLDGGIWAQAGPFPSAAVAPDVAVSQLVALATAFTEENPKIRETGIVLGDRKFMCTYYDFGDKVMRGRKGNTGVAIKQSASALVIGIYDDKDLAIYCNDVVEKLGKYLEDSGY